MLQCNRYPGLDANEIIRLTSAIGQELSYAVSTMQPFKCLLYSLSGRNSESNASPMLSFIL